MDFTTIIGSFPLRPEGGWSFCGAQPKFPEIEGYQECRSQGKNGSRLF
jgi:hypothetical protein